jgi:Protein of unknown function (DUF1761)
VLFDYFGDLNWFAVIVAALAYFVLGYLWYADFAFGKQYRAAIGQADVAAPEPVPIVVNALAWLLAAIALGLIAKAIGADSWSDGLVLGLVVGVGFVLTGQISDILYTKRPTSLLWLNGAYAVIGFAVMGVILGSWT